MSVKISKSEIELFQGRLLDWYHYNGRMFPWREPSISHFDIIIAEILLQRTNAETIKKFYSGFINKYPNWQALVDAQVETIEVDLKPVGLFRQRANRLKKLANEMNERKGVIPRTRKKLEGISMFGQYIANAIELQIFNRKKPLLDINMARVLERYFQTRKLSDIRYDPYLQQLSHKIVDHRCSKEISWAILDFAALICKSQKPLCSKCSLSERCNYFKNNPIKSLT